MECVGLAKRSAEALGDVRDRSWCRSRHGGRRGVRKDGWSHRLNVTAEEGEGRRRGRVFRQAEGEWAQPRSTVSSSYQARSSKDRRGQAMTKGRGEETPCLPSSYTATQFTHFWLVGRGLIFKFGNTVASPMSTDLCCWLPAHRPVIHMAIHNNKLGKQGRRSEELTSWTSR